MVVSSDVARAVAIAVVVTLVFVGLCGVVIYFAFRNKCNGGVTHKHHDPEAGGTTDDLEVRGMAAPGQPVARRVFGGAHSLAQRGKFGYDFSEGPQAVRAPFLKQDVASARTANPAKRNVMYSATSGDLSEVGGIDVSKLVLGEMVGRGANGHVYRGTYLGAEVAVKELSSGSAEGFMSELEALRRLRHPHVIGLYGAAVLGDSNDNPGVWRGSRPELSRRYLLVTELAPCSLRELLDSDEPVSFELALRFAIEISKGCAFIHSMKYVHFDIKPANLLLSEAGRIKICDLGISRHSLAGGNNVKVGADEGGVHGTPAYMAPEVLRAGPGSALSYEVDMYSFSLVFWEILHRRPPHPTQWTVARLFSKLLAGHRPAIGALVPARIRRLLALAWAKEPKRRPNFERVLVELTFAEREFQQPAAAFLAAQDVLVWTKEAFEAGRISRNRGDGKYEVRLAADPTKVRIFPAADILLVDGDEMDEGLGENLLEGANAGGESNHDIVPISAAAAAGAAASAAAKRRRAKRSGPQRVIFSVFDDERSIGLDTTSSSGNSNINSSSDRNSDRSSDSRSRGSLSVRRRSSRKRRAKSPDSEDTDDLVSSQQSCASASEEGRDSMASVVIDGIRINKYGVHDVTTSSNSKKSTQLHSSMVSSSPIHLFSESLVELDELGRGATGTVHRALQLDSFQLVAVKSIKIADAGSRAQIAKEIRAVDSSVRRGGISEATRPKPKAGQNGNGAVTGGTNVGSPGGDAAAAAEDAIAEELSKSKQEREERQKVAAQEKHLLQVLDVFYEPEDASVKIVMEYMDGGSCDDMMKRGEALEESALAAIAVGAINSLAALHAKQRMHRDIKPANLLVDSRHGAKLCDLGLARHMLAAKGGASHENDAVADTFVGTISYMSIERLEGKSYSYPADIHALGLTLLAIALGSNPMRNLSFFQLLELLRSEDCIRVPPEVEARYDPTFCNLLRDCTRSKPELRPSAEQLQEYEWIKNYQSSDMPDPQTVLRSVIDRAAEGPRYKRDMVNSIVARTNAHFVQTNQNRDKPRKVVVSLSKVRRLSQQLGVPVRQTIKAFKYNANKI